MIDHPRYDSMLRAASAQAPLHDELPPFAQPAAPPRPVSPMEEISLQFDREFSQDVLHDAEPNLAWSYERATD